MAEVFGVIISNAAIDQLESILTYIAEESPQGARTQIDRILTSIDRLDTFPAAHPVVGKSRATGLPVHAYSVDAFRIYFTLDEARRRVVVQLIRHGARRQPRRFD
jgi:plasmid stabilization system protein ParE